MLNSIRDKLLLLIMALLFASTAIPSDLYADTYMFHVDSPEMVKVYELIFNIYHALFGSNDFISLLKLTFLIGSIFVFIQAVIKANQDGGGGSNLKFISGYILTVTIILILTFSNKSSILIKANMDTQSYCPESSIPNDYLAKVDGVPDLMAFLFTSMNEAGYKTAIMTKYAFGQVSSNPDTISSSEIKPYTNFGTLNAVKEILTISPESISQKININGLEADLYTSYIQVLSQCILIPASADSSPAGPKILNTFKTTGSPVNTLANFFGISTTASPNLQGKPSLVLYKNPTSQGELIESDIKINGVSPKDMLVSIRGETVSCFNAAKKINESINSAVLSGQIICSAKIGKYLNDETVRLITGQSAVPNKSLATLLAIEAGLSNANRTLASEVSAGEIEYTAGYTIGETIYKYYANGIYMSEVIPYIQTGLRAVIYAIFPFLLIVIILPGGLRAFGEYVKTVIWIELWTPIMFLLSAFLTLDLTKKFGKFYNEDGFNTINGAAVYLDSFALAGTAGYLYAAVPAIAWFVLKGNMALIGKLTGRLESIFKRNLMGSSEAVSNTMREAIISGRSASTAVDRIGSDLSGVAASSRKLVAMSKAAGENLSEAQYKASLFEGIKEGGSLEVKMDVGRETVSHAIKGKMLYDISSGAGLNNAIEGKEDIAALSKKIEFDTVKNIEFGSFLKNIGEDGVETISKNVAAVRVGNDLSKQMSLERIGDFYRHENIESTVRTRAEAAAFERTVDTVTTKGMEKIFGLKDVAEANTTEDIENVYASAGWGMVSVYGAEKAMEDAKAKEIGSGVGKYMAASDMAAYNTVNTVGFESLTEAYNLQKLNEIGRFLATKDVANIIAKTAHKNFGKDIVKTFEYSAQLGVPGETFKHMRSDFFSGVVASEGINSVRTGTIDGSEKVYENERLSYLKNKWNEKDIVDAAAKSGQLMGMAEARNTVVSALTAQKKDSVGDEDYEKIGAKTEAFAKDLSYAAEYGEAKFYAGLLGTGGETDLSKYDSARTIDLTKKIAYYKTAQGLISALYHSHLDGLLDKLSKLSKGKDPSATAMQARSVFISKNSALTKTVSKITGLTTVKAARRIKTFAAILFSAEALHIYSELEKSGAIDAIKESKEFQEIKDIVAEAFMKADIDKLKKLEDKVEEIMKDIKNTNPEAYKQLKEVGEQFRKIFSTEGLIKGALIIEDPTDIVAKAAFLSPMTFAILAPAIAMSSLINFNMRNFEDISKHANTALREARKNLKEFESQLNNVDINIASWKLPGEEGIHIEYDKANDSYNLVFYSRDFAETGRVPIAKEVALDIIGSTVDFKGKARMEVGEKFREISESLKEARDIYFEKIDEGFDPVIARDAAQDILFDLSDKRSFMEKVVSVLRVDLREQEMEGIKESIRKTQSFSQEVLSNLNQGVYKKTEGN